MSQIQATLLIVDDEPEILSLLTENLTPLVSRIITCSNGKDALKLVHSEDVDAVVSDIRMPEMSGLQLLAEMRHQMLLTPFIIMTAFADKENVIEALRLNATDYIEKPFSPSKIKETVMYAIEMGVALREVTEAFLQESRNSPLAADELARKKTFRQILTLLKFPRER